MFEINRSGMEVRTQAVIVLTFPPGFFHRVCFGESCGELDDDDVSSVIVKEFLHCFCFEVPGRFVDEENHTAIFFEKGFDILEKEHTVAGCKGAVHLGSVIGERTVGTDPVF